MKYMLFYTEGCSPKRKAFDSYDDAVSWAGQFLLRNQNNLDDNWVDMIINGRVVETFSAWAKDVADDTVSRLEQSASATAYEDEDTK